MMNRIELDLIDESPLNPRKHFDEAALADLAASIAEQGVLQPLTVRPQGERYEIVIGARRYRASKLAGQTDVPCVVMELGDEATIEIMLVENNQRSDVSPLEEADAIVQLATRFGQSAETIADRIGRSVDFARRRVLLAGLVPDLRTLLETERIGIGSAEMLAALPTAMQNAIAERSLQVSLQTYQGTPQSWNRAQVRMVIEREMRRLSEALWDLDDATLGGEQACSTCPLRSSCQQSLLQDFREDDDQCLDGDCWDSKLAAYLDQQRSAGVEIVEGEDAAKASSWRSAEFKRRSEGRYVDGDYRSWGDAAPDAPVVIAVTESGPVELVRISDLIASGALPADTSDADAAAGKKAREARKAAREEQDRRVAQIVDAVERGGSSSTWLVTIIGGAITELHQDTLKRVCERRGIEAPKRETGGRDYGAAVLEHAQSLCSADCWGLLAEVCLAGSISSTWGVGAQVSEMVSELLDDQADQKGAA